MNLRDGQYLAGLIDGEGCFVIPRQVKNPDTLRCEFIVHLRADDRPLLQELCALVGLGRVVAGRKTHGTGDRADSPSVRWFITRKSECLEFVHILREHQLRSKKARDFDVWARAVEAWCRGDYCEMARLRDQLRALRTYDAELEEGWDEVPDHQLALEVVS